MTTRIPDFQNLPSTTIAPQKRSSTLQRLRDAVIGFALAAAFCSPLANAAPPTIGGATVSGEPYANLRITVNDIVTMIGSYAMHGADAFSWDEYVFWRSRLQQGTAAAVVLQNIYDRPVSRANFPSYFTNTEFVIQLYNMLLGVAPDSAALPYWVNEANFKTKGQVILDLANAALSSARTDPIAARFKQRFDAALVIKIETDTATERNPAATTPIVYNVSRPRLLTISEDPATYNAALTPLARLNWVIDQSAIAHSATYDAVTGELVVDGTELVSLTGANNDIDPSKLTLYGDGAPYALTSGGVEIESATRFRIFLNAADRRALLTRLNRSGTASRGSIAYLVTGSPGWSAAVDAAQAQPALTGTRISVKTSPLNIDASFPATYYDAATDGVLLIRYLLGYRGAALITDARGVSATLRDAGEIETHIANHLTNFDVDGDGKTLALTDGLMILRRLLNPNTVAAMTVDEQSAITANAKRGSLTDVQVLQRIEALKP